MAGPEERPSQPHNRHTHVPDHPSSTHSIPSHPQQDLNPRNFVTKIVKYDKVVDVPNSMTVLTDLLPISLTMAQRKLTGGSVGGGVGMLWMDGWRDTGAVCVVCLFVVVGWMMKTRLSRTDLILTYYYPHSLPPTPGVYNFTNPGAISHNEILALYKKHVDPSYTWTNFTVGDQY